MMGGDLKLQQDCCTLMVLQCWWRSSAQDWWFLLAAVDLHVGVPALGGVKEPGNWKTRLDL